MFLQVHFKTRRCIQPVRTASLQLCLCFFVCFSILVQSLNNVADERVDPTTHNNKALILASQSGNANVVSALLKHPKVDPLAQNNAALIEAITFARSGVVDVLLDDDRVDDVVEDYQRYFALLGHVV